MYASNDDEDWVYLQQTPPVNPIFHGVINRKRSNSSSSSSITSCSSQSNRSISLSSLCSTELEQAQHEPVSTNDTTGLSAPEQKSYPLESRTVEDLSPSSDHDNHSRTAVVSELPSSSTVISTSSEPAIERQAATNENDALAVESEPRSPPSLTNSTSPHSESLPVPKNLRRRHSTGVTAQRTDFASAQIRQSPSISRHIKWPSEMNKNDTLLSCTCIVLLLMSSFILGQIVAQWDQSTVTRITRELDRTNQRLSEVQDTPTGTVEGKLTRQLEDKLQNMVHQQLTWHDYEKDSFFKQIHELRQILNLTKQNLTNTIDRLTDENGQLQERIKLLERRLKVTVEEDRKESFAETNCTNVFRPTVDKFVASVFKQTSSIAANTSTSLSGLFEHLSASVSNLVDHRHEYMNKSRQKLTDLAASPAAGKVQGSFRQGLDNLSSSFHKAKVSSASWVKSHILPCGTAMVQHSRWGLRRAQDNLSSSFRKAKVSSASWVKSHILRRETVTGQPWRWGFRRDQDWIRPHHQTSSQGHTYQSKFDFPMTKIRSMKNWVAKMFRA